MAALDELETGLQQQFLRKGVADLNLGPTGLGIVAEFFGSERRSVDSISPGARPHCHKRVSDPFGFTLDEILGLHESEAHRVHNGIPLIAAVEVDLPADVRDAYTVAVVADPLHHAGEKITNPSSVEISKTERVQYGDRTGAHGEHVTKNAAHAGRRALVRFDGRGVVVRLDLERQGQAASNIDDTRVLARALDHPGRRRRQETKETLGVLVAAMLRPHRAEHAEFSEGGFPPQDLEYTFVLRR